MTQTLKTVAALMQESGVAFGTSGARGLVTAMTDQVCYAYTTGFLQFLVEDGVWAGGERVALAGDLRPSTPRILAACVQAVRDLGGEPVFCGYVPTPALAHWAFAEGIPSLMVTGSHIPDDRNGIKFYRPRGEILKDDEPGITRQTVDLGRASWTPAGLFETPPPLPAITDIRAGYVDRYVRYFGAAALRGRRIGVYQHSAVGRDLLVEILTALGAQVTPLGRSAIFVPVDTEAVRPEDVALARGWAAEHGFDALASTDGDSDRPLLADHTGEWLRGDVLGVLCARQLGAHAVVTPVSSNTLVEQCGAFAEVHRTRIGSPYVIAQMNAALAASAGMVCGYEANGGFLLANTIGAAGQELTALPTRDAVLPIIAALVAAGPGSLRDLLDSLPARVTYSDRIEAFAPERRDRLMAWLVPAPGSPATAELDASFAPMAGAPLSGVDLTDGVRMTFANNRIIHLRGSGNAPELRCYSEAEDAASARRLNEGGLAFVRERF